MSDKDTDSVSPPATNEPDASTPPSTETQQDDANNNSNEAQDGASNSSTHGSSHGVSSTHKPQKRTASTLISNLSIDRTDSANSARSKTPEPHLVASSDCSAAGSESGGSRTNSRVNSHRKKGLSRGRSMAGFDENADSQHEERLASANCEHKSTRHKGSLKREATPRLGAFYKKSERDLAPAKNFPSFADLDDMELDIGQHHHHKKHNIEKKHGLHEAGADLKELSSHLKGSAHVMDSSHEKAPSIDLEAETKKASKILDMFFRNKNMDLLHLAARKHFRGSVFGILIMVTLWGIVTKGGFEYCAPPKKKSCECYLDDGTVGFVNVTQSGSQCTTCDDFSLARFLFQFRKSALVMTYLSGFTYLIARILEFGTKFHTFVSFLLLIIYVLIPTAVYVSGYNYGTAAIVFLLLGLWITKYKPKDISTWIILQPICLFFFMWFVVWMYGIWQFLRFNLAPGSLYRDFFFSVVPIIISGLDTCVRLVAERTYLELWDTQDVAFVATCHSSFVEAFRMGAFLMIPYNWIVALSMLLNFLTELFCRTDLYIRTWFYFRGKPDEDSNKISQILVGSRVFPKYIPVLCLVLLWIFGGVPEYNWLVMDRCKGTEIYFPFDLSQSYNMILLYILTLLGTDLTISLLGPGMRKAREAPEDEDDDWDADNWLATPDHSEVYDSKLFEPKTWCLKKQPDASIEMLSDEEVVKLVTNRILYDLPSKPETGTVDLEEEQFKRIESIFSANNDATANNVEKPKGETVGAQRPHSSMTSRGPAPIHVLSESLGIRKALKMDESPIDADDRGSDAGTKSLKSERLSICSTKSNRRLAFHEEANLQKTKTSSHPLDDRQVSDPDKSDLDLPFSVASPIHPLSSVGTPSQSPPQSPISCETPLADNTSEGDETQASNELDQTSFVPDDDSQHENDLTDVETPQKSKLKADGGKKLSSVEQHKDRLRPSPPPYTPPPTSPEVGTDDEALEGESGEAGTFQATLVPPEREAATTTATIVNSKKLTDESHNNLQEKKTTNQKEAITQKPLSARQLMEEEKLAEDSATQRRFDRSAQQQHNRAKSQIDSALHPFLLPQRRDRAGRIMLEYHHFNYVPCFSSFVMPDPSLPSYMKPRLSRADALFGEDESGNISSSGEGVVVAVLHPSLILLVTPAPHEQSNHYVSVLTAIPLDRVLDICEHEADPADILRIVFRSRVRPRPELCAGQAFSMSDELYRRPQPPPKRQPITHDGNTGAPQAAPADPPKTGGGFGFFRRANPQADKGKEGKRETKSSNIQNHLAGRRASTGMQGNGVNDSGRPIPPPHLKDARYWRVSVRFEQPADADAVREHISSQKHILHSQKDEALKLHMIRLCSNSLPHTT